MDLYPATLNGFPLAIEAVSDAFAKALARYEFPYRDGALLEDMGQKARTIRLKCYFWDGADNRTYDLHVDFINSLADQTLFELVHPTYGPVSGCVETVSITQDDRQRTAEVEISFVENLRGTTAVIQVRPAQDVQGACEAAFSANILQSIAAFGAEAVHSLGAEASTVLSRVLNPALPVPGQFAGLSIPAASFVGAVSNGIDTLNETLSAITNPPNSLLAAVNFPPTLPGMAVQATARACERTILARQSLETNPGSWTSTVSDDFSGLIAGFSSDAEPGEQQ